MKQVAVIGLGRFGTNLAKKLMELGCEVLAIDSNQEHVDEVVDIVTHAVQADATDEEVLKALGIRNFDIVVIAIGHDVQASILVAVLVMELGVNHVIAKAQNELHGKVLEKVGVNKVVYPERDMGIRVAHNLLSTNVIDYIELSPEYSIAEIVTPESYIGKTLGDLDLRARFGINVLAIKRGDDFIIAPGANTTLAQDDYLIIIGKSKAVDKLS